MYISDSIVAAPEVTVHIAMKSNAADRLCYGRWGPLRSPIDVIMDRAYQLRPPQFREAVGNMVT